MNKKIYKRLLIVLSSILVFLLIFFCLIYYVILSPKNSFNRFFNTIFDKASLVVSRFSTDEFKTSINKGNLKLSTNLEKYNNLIDYEIEYDVENDRVNDKTLINIKFGNMEENIESTFYKDADYLYVNFPYIMSDIIKIDLEKYGLKSNSKNISYNKKDMEYLLSIIKNSFVNNISEKKLKNSIKDSHIKSTYKIDNKEFENLLNKVVNDLKSDQESMRILNDVFSIDNEKLDDYKKEIINNFIDNFEFLNIDLNYNILLKLDSIVIKTKKHDFNLLIDDMSELVIKLNGSIILNSSFNDKKIKINMYRNSKEIKIDLNVDTSKDELNLEGYVSYYINNSDYIKLDLSLGTLLNEKISDFDSSLAKSFNQFTNKDLKSLYKIIDLINKYIKLLTDSEVYNINIKI